MKAVDADPAGTMKKMLQDTAPVTAFVPVDKVGTQQQLVLLLQTSVITISEQQWGQN
jgi:hypothetical protein